MEKSMRLLRPAKSQPFNYTFFTFLLLFAILSFIGYNFLLPVVHANELEESYNEVEVANTLFSQTLQYEHRFLQLVVVEINNNGTKEIILTEPATVSEILVDGEIEHSEADLILPAVDTKIYSNTKIDITSHVVEEIEEVELIPFEIEYINDPTLDAGLKNIIDYGEDGLLKKRFKVTSLDSEITEKVEIESVVEKEPRNMIVYVGTKQKPVIVPPQAPKDDRRCDHWYGVVDEATSDETERLWLKNLMVRESGCNSSADNRAGNLGLLQFTQSTFKHYGGSNIWDGADQINAALNIYRIGGCKYHWPYCL